MKKLTIVLIHKQHLHRLSTVFATASLLTLLLAPSFAWALYKVVGPDGKVTYTDQMPTKQPAQVLSTVRGSLEGNPLPYALAQVTSRYPVTLYAFKGCTPCDQGRSYLMQRGVPFAEKSVNTKADLKALEQSTGSKQMPLLRIGQQQINGYSSGEWGRYLDAAGYPTESALPKNYRWPDITPMVTVSTPDNTENQEKKTEPIKSKPRGQSSLENASGIRF